MITANTLSTNQLKKVPESFRSPQWVTRKSRTTRTPKARSDSRRAHRQQLEAMEDIDLLQTVLQGDQLAWSVFYDRFRNLMIACVSRVCVRVGARLQPDDLSDILAEICMNMVAKDYRRLRLYRVDGGCSVSSWIGVIATSTAHDHLRKERRRRLEPMQDSDIERVAPPVEGPDITLIDRQQRAFVDQALTCFSQRDRRFVELYFVDAMSPEAIAKEMGVSVSTVYSKKAKIKTRLRALAKAAA